MIDLRMADLNIRIDNRYDYLEKQCLEYIIPSDAVHTFRPDIYIQAEEAEINQMKNKLSGFYRKSDYAESIVAYEKLGCLLPSYNAFIIHASVISIDGQAFGFAAKSGIGKSTHTHFWKELFGERVIVINGDKPICRFEGYDLMAFGTPWCGKEGWNTNTKAPLKALCLLERSDENSINRVDGFEQLANIMDQFYLPGSSKIDMSKLMELISRMLDSIRVYRLAVKNEISAAKTAAEQLLSI